ncbi:MAG: PHP domain-containing protein, partial [Nitrosopumilaceae archaeon]|nr:PHP domain-containing protein [Nitrosopumilaceae archaeon]
LPLPEVLDEIRRQDGVSSAPHPFSLLDALRGDAAHCDIIEVFNSNNVDAISNARAAEFAASHSMTAVAGSDSHILSTMGRCVNAVHSQNTLDNMLPAIRHGRVDIERSGYALGAETLEHLQYKIRNSRRYLEGYIAEHYPNAAWLLNLLLRVYSARPDSALWAIFYRLGVYLMGRISSKVNEHGVDPDFMRDRNLATMLRMAL